MNRRDFLIGCGAGAALMATSKWRLLSASPVMSLENGSNHTLVVVFLRGGCDGLQLIAPVSNQHYQDARPTRLKVSEQEGGHGIGEYQGTAFALHPKAAALQELFDSGDLAIIHSCGLINGTRSHFDAMDLIERGLAKDDSVYDGWMARYLNSAQPAGQLPGVSVSRNLSRSFAGYSRATSIKNLRKYNLVKGMRDPELIRAMYQNDPLMGPAAMQTLDTIQYLKTNLSKTERQALREGLPGYPKDWASRQLSRSLQNVSQLIKMNAGVRMVNVDYGGWDTHENQDDIFPRLVQGLSSSLSAFYNDIEAHRNNVTVIVMSEFGRRLRANRSQGTDHGHGNFMLALGGRVKGGKHYGEWPGLHPDALDKGVDLAVTTDYRSVLGHALQQGMGLDNVPTVFPGFNRTTNLGFMS